jgi:murein DD-endopeptidase MepM/ murein hydrolase activator NlpD
MVARPRLPDVRAIPRVPGPDRKTPSDGVPQAPGLGPDPGDPQNAPSPAEATPLGPPFNAASAPTAAAPPPTVSPVASPDPPAISAPLSATPLTPDGTVTSAVIPRRESETPQAASISSARLEGEDRATHEPARRGRSLSLFSRVATYVGRLGHVAGLRNVSGVRKAIAAAGGVAAILGAIFIPRFVGEGDSTAPSRVSAASLGGAVSGLGGVLDGGTSLFGDTRGLSTDAATDPPDAAADAATRPAVWRIAQLASNPDVSLVDVPVAHHPLAVALAGTRVPRAEGQRLIASLGDVHSIDHFGPKDALTVAVDKTTGHVMAFEFSSSPADVWQGRDEDDAGSDGAKLWAKKLKLEIERVRIRKAVLVGADLHASFVDAGLGPIDDLLPMLDDALDGHAELSDVRPGARLRIVATQDQVDGAFVRWVSLEAVEYFPATPTAPSVRVYRFGEDDDSDGAEKDAPADRSRHPADLTGKHRRGWYDGKGRQPLHGGWRTPVPLARITSRFNPHRMHPVLHVVMPHNGVDFAAPVGTPVYATAAGTVLSAGNGGPCGNKIEIAHPGNIVSVYCHLSRFAAGMHAGLHVEQRQLIAYVGQTGRVTGPHLHFGIRRAGVVIDPMTLRLDGMRVVPRAQRDEFDKQRAALDAELDGVPLPAATGASAPAELPETNDSFYEEP